MKNQDAKNKESMSDKKAKRMDVDYSNPYPPFPREVFFDLNNTCNSKCFFCSNPKIASPAYLDKELGFKLLKEFYEDGTREIAFYATGEPFIRNDLVEFVKEAKSIGYEYIFLSSNGILATPEKARPVLEAGLDSIKFSVNAGKRQSYKNVHGVDRFDKVIENIKWFYDFREQSGLKYKIYISMVPSSRAANEWPILQTCLKDYVDEIDCRSCSNQGGNMYENNSTENIDKNNLLGSSNKHNGRCPDIFFRCTVTPRGYLSACIVDYRNYLIVADLHKTKVRDAWHNDIYVSLRKKHNERRLKGILCYNCLNNCNIKITPTIADFALE